MDEQTGPRAPVAGVDADAVLTASRALLAVVARSLAPVLDQVTLPQFRALVVLSSSPEPLRSGDLAAALGVHPSTFTRTADRLVAAGWVRRVENPGNRREILVELTDDGRALVEEVTGRRRQEIEGILGRLDEADREQVHRGLEAFARAAGEPSVHDLSALGL